MKQLKAWVGDIIEVGIGIISLGVLAQVLFGKSVPFVGAVVDTSPRSSQGLERTVWSALSHLALSFTCSSERMTNELDAHPHGRRVPAGLRHLDFGRHYGRPDLGISIESGRRAEAKCGFGHVPSADRGAECRGSSRRREARAKPVDGVSNLRPVTGQASI